MIQFRSNIHTHSTFSDGKHTPEEIVLTAVEKGFTTVGFSDHSYTAFDEHYCLPHDRYAAYRDEISALKTKYEGRIEILCGTELDYYSAPELKDGFDYFITGVHYLFANGVYHPVDSSAAETARAIREGFGGDERAYVRRYYEAVAESAALSPVYAAHFDLLTKFSTIDESDAFYRRISLETLDALLDRNMPIEVNTGAMARGAKDIPYPSAFILERIAERGGAVIFGSDCHDRTKLDYAFDSSLEIVRRAGVKHIVEYRGGRLQLIEEK